VVKSVSGAGDFGVFEYFEIGDGQIY